MSLSSTNTCFLCARHRATTIRKICGWCERKRRNAIVAKFPKRSCPHCHAHTIHNGGYYSTLQKPRRRKRYQCATCNHSFTARPRHLQRRQWPVRVYRELRHLAFRQKLSVRKYDHAHAPLYYSTRELAALLSKKYHCTISKSSIAVYLRKWHAPRTKQALIKTFKQ